MNIKDLVKEKALPLLKKMAKDPIPFKRGIYRIGIFIGSAFSLVILFWIVFAIIVLFIQILSAERCTETTVICLVAIIFFIPAILLSFGIPLAFAKVLTWIVEGFQKTTKD